MARKARTKAESGVYHIVLKGNNKLLFVEPQDYEKFLQLVSQYAERDCMEVYAYCLFDEAVHLAVKEGLVYLGDTLKNLVAKYALWYNEKYARTGKLFYDRFASEPLETDAELLDAVRYVHRLPLQRKADLNYIWSSYNNYLKKTGLKSETLMLLFDNSPLSYRMFFDSPCEGTYLSDKPKPKLTDEQLKAVLREMLNGVTNNEIESLSEKQSTLLLRKFKQIEGASIRQIARVLGMSKARVEKA